MSSLIGYFFFKFKYSTVISSKTKFIYVGDLVISLPYSRARPDLFQSHYNGLHTITVKIKVNPDSEVQNFIQD